MRTFFRTPAVPVAVPSKPSDDDRYGVLARNLEGLASPTRLGLLHSLRSPKALHEIRVPPSLTRGAESPERPLSRQAVTRHLDQLLELGLITKKKAGGPREGDRFVLSSERLFALVDELRNLVKLRPVVSAAVVPGSTVDVARGGASLLPKPPRLFVAYGREDGTGFSIAGPPGARWRIGRDPACEIRLDYDPYLSAQNSILEASAAGYVLHDVTKSRNGTCVNWSPLPRGGSRPLQAGDVITVGRSLLVFQPQ